MWLWRWTTPTLAYNERCYPYYISRCRNDHHDVTTYRLASDLHEICVVNRLKAVAACSSLLSSVLRIMDKLPDTQYTVLREPTWPLASHSSISSMDKSMLQPTSLEKDQLLCRISRFQSPVYPQTPRPENWWFSSSLSILWSPFVFPRSARTRCDNESFLQHSASRLEPRYQVCDNKEVVDIPVFDDTRSC